MYYVTQGDLAIIPNRVPTQGLKRKTFTLAEIPTDHATNPLIGEALRPGEEGYLAVTGLQYLFCKICRVLLTEPGSDPIDPSGTVLGRLAGQLNQGAASADLIATAVAATEEKIKLDEQTETLDAEERLASLTIGSIAQDPNTGETTIYIEVTNSVNTVFTMFLDSVAVGVV